MRRHLIIGGTALFALLAGVANAQTQGSTGSLSVGGVTVTGPAVTAPTTPSVSGIVNEQAAKVGAKADAKINSATQKAQEKVGAVQDKANAAVDTANQTAEKVAKTKKAARDAASQGVTVGAGGVSANVSVPH